jgi:lipopolysaccharide-induced tumor necrosis factor-alpha factor
MIDTEDHKASAPPMHQQFPPQPGAGYDPASASGGAYPPQPGYPQPPSYPMGQGCVHAHALHVAHARCTGAPMQTTVIITQSTTMGPRPAALTCPKCQAQIITETTHNPGLMAWLIAGVLCFFGYVSLDECEPICCVCSFGCGCCLIPFCIDDCQDVEHRCPNCKSFLGQYKRL